ncbi:TPA: hypothetical protein DIC39_00835 [Patescibacteria group bacterium]|nr:hypothetical protein [Patescibacteria group bacterium]
MNAAIKAALKAYYDFRISTVKEALDPIHKYGKRDTLGMDAGPEITICEELSRYDMGAVVITEEVGSRQMQYTDVFRASDPQTFRTVYISDPTDRSNQLKGFLKEFPQDKKIGDIFGSPSTVALWEKKFSGPAVITGATSAISCVRRGTPIFSVIVNYVTQHLIVSCVVGNRILKLPSERTDIDLPYIRSRGKAIVFPGIGTRDDSMRRFVTFLGDVGKVGYRENFIDSGLMNNVEKEIFLHYGQPGGPSRILYLSNLQPKNKPLGFILANGEKIVEWIHWLSFARFAKSYDDESQSALTVYEVFQDRPWTKQGVLMSTPPNYSVFREYDHKMVVDTGWLLVQMPNPSQLRSTLIIAPFDNRWAVRAASQSGFRSLTF